MSQTAPHNTGSPIKGCQIFYRVVAERLLKNQAPLGDAGIDGLKFQEVDTRN